MHKCIDYYLYICIIADIDDSDSIYGYLSMTAHHTLKRLASPLIDPAVYDFWAQKLSPTLSWDRALARVVERHIEARDTVSLTLKPNGHFAGFQPGQHVNVTVEVNGSRLTRSYSPSAAIRRNGLIRLTIKAIPEGKVSQQLVHHTQVGDVIELSRAFGEMTLPNSPQPWLLIAAGSGITPIMSLLETLAATPLRQPVSLIYWARTRADICFSEALHQLANRDPLLRIHTVLTREDQPLENEFKGRPREDLFRHLVPDLEHRHVYACGPDGFVRSVQSLLDGHTQSFKAESFSPAPRAVASGAPITVQLSKSQISVQVPSGTPLLEALEAQGLKPAYGCRMGICNTCACQKEVGATADIRTGDAHGESGTIRLCISSATTDLTLEL